MKLLIKKLCIIIILVLTAIFAETYIVELHGDEDHVNFIIPLFVGSLGLIMLIAKPAPNKGPDNERSSTVITLDISSLALLSLFILIGGDSVFIFPKLVAVVSIVVALKRIIPETRRYMHYHISGSYRLLPSRMQWIAIYGSLIVTALIIIVPVYLYII